MVTVFDIIQKLLDEKGLSVRRLAQLAKMAPTTLESIMTRKPKWVSVARLESIARVFQLHWTDLFEPGREEYVTDTNPPKVSSYIKAEQAEEIVERALEKSGQGFAFAFDFRVEQQSKEKDDEVLFRKSVNAILNRLNSDGLLEAMRHLLTIEENPVYRKENKEKTEV